ncbi:retrovirus-related pol polyprotein from transposon TNT 1-94 [Tanacetum coccineum]
MCILHLSELLEDGQKKKLGKNNEVKMTRYNALPRKEYERVFLCKTAKEDLRPPKKRLSLALKAKVTREQTSNDSGSQRGSDEDIDEEKVDAFNLLARNFRECNRFERGNQFGNNGNRFGKGRGNSFEDKGGESSKKKGACYNCGIEGHFASECRNLNENKAFIRGGWSDSKDGDEQLNDATCLMAINSQEVVSKPSSSNIDLNIMDLQKENEELLKFNKDFTKTFEKLSKEQALKNENLKISSKINDLEIEVTKLESNTEVVDLAKHYELAHQRG